MKTDKFINPFYKYFSGNSERARSEPAAGGGRHAQLQPARHRHQLRLRAVHEVHHTRQTGCQGNYCLLINTVF